MSEQMYFLQDRVSRLQSFTGIDSETTVPPPSKLSDRIQQCIAKLPKDIQTKFEKIKKLINTYNRVIDDILIEEKIETINSEEEEMNEIAQELEQIDQLTKYLNMEQLFGLNSRTADLRLLSSSSKLEFLDVKEPLKAVEFKETELAQLTQKHRSQFEQLVLLNSSVVASLNQRIKAMDNRISEMERR